MHRTICPPIVARTRKRPGRHSGRSRFIISANLLVSPFLEKGNQGRHVFLLDGYVQIAMLPRLHADEAVHAPTAVNPCIYAQALQLVIKVNYIPGGPNDLSLQPELLRIG